MPKARSSCYLGIDPSLTSTGITYVHGNLCVPARIRPPKGMVDVRRLQYIRENIEIVLDQARLFGDILGAAVEGAAYYAVNRADALGQLRGVLLTFLADRKIETLVIPPTAVKLFGTNSGNAKKPKMIAAARAQWPANEFNEDSADAAWLARIAQAYFEGTSLPGLSRVQLEVVQRMHQKNNHD